jgi:hypothetical protein
MCRGDEMAAAAKQHTVAIINKIGFIRIPNLFDFAVRTFLFEHRYSAAHRGSTELLFVRHKLMGGICFF